MADSTEWFYKDRAEEIRQAIWNTRPVLQPTTVIRSYAVVTEDTKPLPGETEIPDDDSEQPDEPAVPEPDEQPKTDAVEE